MYIFSLQWQLRYLSCWFWSSFLWHSKTLFCSWLLSSSIFSVRCLTSLRVFSLFNSSWLLTSSFTVSYSKFFFCQDIKQVQPWIRYDLQYINQLRQVQKWLFNGGWHENASALLLPTCRVLTYSEYQSVAWHMGNNCAFLCTVRRVHSAQSTSEIKTEHLPV